MVVVVVGGLEVWDEKERQRGKPVGGGQKEYGRIPRWRGGVAPSNTTK